MRASTEAYGREWSPENFAEAQTQLVRDGTVDFGILNEEMQRTIIRAVHTNPSIFSADLGDSSATIEPNKQRVEEAYSTETYGDALLSIYRTLLKTPPGSVRYANSDVLLDAFLNPARFNLLRS